MSEKKRHLTGWIGVFFTISWILLILVQPSAAGSTYFILMSSRLLLSMAGLLPSFFRPSRGVRQGCPLSPLLYVLLIEVLAANIRSAPGITGVFLPQSLEQFKCSGYADDTTIAATSDESTEEIFAVYCKFEHTSGARLNHGKLKGMWLGSWKQHTDAPFGLQWVKQLPLLGATFCAGNYSELTWEPATAKLEK